MARVATLGAGVLTVLVAVASPLSSAADTSLTAHMVQHVLLLAVASPLLALGAPRPTILRALPEPVRGRVRRAWRPVLRQQSRHWLAATVATLVLQAAVMWAWHLPALYDAAERQPLLHGLEHISFLVSSTLFWWVVTSSRRSRRGVAVLALFAGGLPGTALGAALLLAPRPWYPHYAGGSVGHGLADQQLAGVVMWSFAGLAYVVGAAVLFGRWLADNERRTPARLATVAPVEVVP